MKPRYHDTQRSPELPEVPEGYELVEIPDEMLDNYRKAESDGDQVDEDDGLEDVGDCEDDDDEADEDEWP